MRHGKKFNHLSRTASHRKAMLSNMACSLIIHKRIKTTLAKAKALRVYIEPLMTKSKNDTTHSRRIVFSYLKQKEAVSELFGDVSRKIESREGGYTRILKLGNRSGDNAQMCFIELVDYNESYTTDKPKRKKARRRSKKHGVESPVLKKSTIEKDTLKETQKEEIIQEPPSEEEVPAEEVSSEEEVPAEEVSSEEEANKEDKNTD